MEHQDLERIRFVTRHFRDLQGLRRLVPAGLLLLSGAGLNLFLSLALFAGACLLLFVAGRYYGNTFGEVEAPQTEPVAELSSLLLTAEGPAHGLRPVIPAVPRLLILGGLTCAVFLLFQFLFWPPWVTIDSEVVAWSGNPEMTRTMLIRMLYGLGALFFLGTAWLRRHHPSQGHLLGIGFLLSALATLGPSLAPAIVSFQAALLLCGSSLVLAGLLDHWQLVRGLR